MARPQECPCGSKLFPNAKHDGYGIFMAYMCDVCEPTKLAGYRSDIFSRYDCDEPIDDD